MLRLFWLAPLLHLSSCSHMGANSRRVAAQAEILEFHEIKCEPVYRMESGPLSEDELSRADLFETTTYRLESSPEVEGHFHSLSLFSNADKAGPRILFNELGQDPVATCRYDVKTSVRRCSVQGSYFNSYFSNRTFKKNAKRANYTVHFLMGEAKAQGYQDGGTYFTFPAHLEWAQTYTYLLQCRASR